MTPTGDAALKNGYGFDPHQWMLVVSFYYYPALKGRRKGSNSSSVLSKATGLNKNSEGSIPASSFINYDCIY